MTLYGEVVSVIDNKLMIVQLQDGKQVFLPWSGNEIGTNVQIKVMP